MKGKLVRDKIPCIIRAKEENCKTEKLNSKDFLVELNKKLVEEVNEYLTSSSKEDKLEELADILEVVYTLSKNIGSVEEVLTIKETKRLERGGFEEGIFLIEE